MEGVNAGLKGGLLCKFHPIEIERGNFNIMECPIYSSSASLLVVQILITRIITKYLMTVQPKEGEIK